MSHRVKPQISSEEYDAKLVERGQTITGREVVSDVPMAPPIGYVKQPSMVEHIRNMVRSEMLRREVEDAGAETFEEADDFEMDDDPVPMSGYENDPEFEPAIPGQSSSSSSSSSTGVPPPGGGGEGAGGEPPKSEGNSPGKEEVEKATPDGG